MPARSLLVHDAVLVDVHGRRDRGWVRTERGRIAEVGSGDGWRLLDPPPDSIVHAAGAVLTPGLIDLHCHGGAGRSYCDDDPSDALALHRAHGTTRTLISLVSATIETQQRWLADVVPLVRRDPLVLGVHLEGPYLASRRCGAHDPAVLIDPSRESVERQLDASGETLAMVTIAPERAGADDAIDAFVAAGVVVAVGHTDADHGTARAAFDRGATVLTHAFNAMAPIHHRAPGPVLAAVDSGAFLELILDGVHVHSSVASGLFRLAPGQVALVTDATAAAGCADGRFGLGGLDVELADGRVTLAGTDTLAGSALTQDAALARAVDELGLDVVDAVAALTSVPAAALGRDDLGRLRAGNLADLVVWDDAWSPTLVVADGDVLHHRL